MMVNRTEPVFTGKDGTIKVHLVNLPLDGAVIQVKATCDCGDTRFTHQEH